MESDLLEPDGLILVSRDSGFESRLLARDVARGVLVKVRRGAYVRAKIWDGLDGRQRHTVRIAAAAADSRQPIVAAGHSAAALWEMPILRPWPTEVLLLDRWRGGGRSEPGVRRTVAGFATAQVELAGGFRVTDLLRTCFDVGKKSDFVNAVAIADWTLARAGVGPETLLAELIRMGPGAPRARLEPVIRFASALSGSVGESMVRLALHRSQFMPPVLQAEFSDHEGRMFVDFYWPAAGVVLEFDGKSKYTRDEFTRGDPGEVVWREKLREDRLRRLGLVVVRAIWADLHHVDRLSARLEAAHVPRGGG